MPPDASGLRKSEHRSGHSWGSHGNRPPSTGSEEHEAVGAAHDQRDRPSHLAPRPFTDGISRTLTPRVSRTGAEDDSGGRAAPRLPRPPRLPRRDRASRRDPGHHGGGAHRGHEVSDGSSDEKDGRSQRALQLLLLGPRRHGRQPLVQGEQRVLTVRPRLGIGPGHLQPQCGSLGGRAGDPTAPAGEVSNARASPGCVRVCARRSPFSNPETPDYVRHAQGNSSGESYCQAGGRDSRPVPSPQHRPGTGWRSRG